MYQLTVLIVSPRLENKFTTSCWEGAAEDLVADLVRDSDRDLTIWVLFMLFGNEFLNK